jgi:hypothetical protein
MSTSIVSSYTNKLSISMEDGIFSSFDSNTLSSSYTYGSGNAQVTNAISMTGVLSSGLSTRIDLTAVPQQTFAGTQYVSFTGIKHISVINKSESNGYDFNICATGTSAFTNLFNGGSGNLTVKPYSTFSQNSPNYATPVTSGNKFLFMKDSGSGTNYKVMILGLT